MVFFSVIVFGLGLVMIMSAGMSNLGYKDAEAGRTFGWSGLLIAGGVIVAVIGLNLLVGQLK